MATSMKTPSQAKSKPNQNDLRRLMKEKLGIAKENSKRIDSPLAKYNNLGQLFCVLCNCQVKSEFVWTAHINGRQHKQSSEFLKTKNQKTEDEIFKKPSSAAPIISGKRKADDDAGPQTLDTKKIKMPPSHDGDLPPDFFDSSLPSSSVSRVSLSGSSVPMDEDDDQESELSALANAANSSLPPDFFSGDNQTVESTSSEAVEEAPSNGGRVANKLPEGFFDDPVVDAKVRKVEYKDPVEEEWERFQKEIVDATTKAQVIMDEEEEESTTERQIVEIDEQIHNWARVEALQIRKDELAAKQREHTLNSADDEDADIEAQEYEEFLDWRSKGSWR